MSRKKKILIYFQLFFALFYFCWLLVQPYAKEMVSHQSTLALYEMITNHKEHFQKLSNDEQAYFLKGYEEAQKQEPPSLLNNLGRDFFTNTSTAALIWLFSCLIICSLLLLQKASWSVWILPLAVVCYGFSLYKASDQKPESIFPKKEYVLDNYATLAEIETLSTRDSLLLGWHRYLINEWAHETPNENPELLQSQLDKGLFAFNAARLKWMAEGKGDEIVITGFTSSPSLLRLICYFIWNVFFAWFITRKKLNMSCVAASPPLC